jgi:lipid kinase YegS
MANIRLILNGKSSGDQRVRRSVTEIRERSHQVSVRVTWEADDMPRLMNEALEDAAKGRIDTIVAGGGDGTVNGVFSSAFTLGIPAGCTFGILPLGTANDFARSAGLPVEDLTASLLMITGTPASAIDLGLFDGRPFVNLLTGGFGSEVTAETDPALKHRLGGLAYALTGLLRIGNLSASSGVFRAENFEWEGAFSALAIGNGRQAGGGIQLCPEATINDGLLDLMIMPHLPHSERAEALGRLLRQGKAAVRSVIRTAKSPWFTYQSTEDLHVNLDGEPTRTNSFRVECRPAAISVHIGNSPLLAPPGGDADVLAVTSSAE